METIEASKIKFRPRQIGRDTVAKLRAKQSLDQGHIPVNLPVIERFIGMSARGVCSIVGMPWKRYQSIRKRGSASRDAATILAVRLREYLTKLDTGDVKNVRRDGSLHGTLSLYPDFTDPQRYFRMTPWKHMIYRQFTVDDYEEGNTPELISLFYRLWGDTKPPRQEELYRNYDYALEQAE